MTRKRPIITMNAAFSNGSSRQPWNATTVLDLTGQLENPLSGEEARREQTLGQSRLEQRLRATGGFQFEATMPCSRRCFHLRQRMFLSRRYCNEFNREIECFSASRFRLSNCRRAIDEVPGGEGKERADGARSSRASAGARRCAIVVNGGEHTRTW